MTSTSGAVWTASIFMMVPSSLTHLGTIPSLTQTDPLQQFHLWYTQAQDHPVPQPEGTTLSTANLPSGRISARTVYLKELDSRGFVVYSNWGTSKKSKDVASNPHAALTFWWREQERQVRVEGVTERLKPEESQMYYDTRYLYSQG